MTHCQRPEVTRSRLVRVVVLPGARSLRRSRPYCQVRVGRNHLSEPIRCAHLAHRDFNNCQSLLGNPTPTRNYLLTE